LGRPHHERIPALLVDGGVKLFKPPAVVKATTQLGYPESVIVGLWLRDRGLQEQSPLRSVAGYYQCSVPASDTPPGTR
jgi:hypothetical protein